MIMIKHVFQSQFTHESKTKDIQSSLEDLAGRSWSVIMYHQRHEDIVWLGGRWKPPWLRELQSEPGGRSQAAPQIEVWRRQAGRQ